MAFIYLFEWLLIVTVIMALLTQVTLPLLLDRPLFPFFRGWRKAQTDLAEANADIESALLERDITARRNSAKTIRSNE